jgi:hypothetical protein
MEYSIALENALANAAPIDHVNGQWIPRLTHAQAYGRVPRKDGHNSPVMYPPRRKLHDMPHGVQVDTLADLDELVVDYHDRVGLALDREALDKTLRHEGQHAEIIGLLGGSAFHALELFENKEAEQTFWVISTSPYDLRTTKLGYALIRVYPEDPSPPDIHQAQAVGYRNVQHVGDVAAAYGLPQPLS